MMGKEIVFNGWKQPIPVGLDQIFGEDYRCMALYMQLIYKACNSKALVTFAGTTQVLERGQVMYGRKKFAQYLCWKASTVDRALKKLKTLYNLIEFQRTRVFTVVTIKKYDEVVGMSNQRTTPEQPVNTSKSVKSEKSEDTKSQLTTLSQKSHPLGEKGDFQSFSGMLDLKRFGALRSQGGAP